MTALFVSRHAILDALVRRGAFENVRDLVAVSDVPLSTLYRAATTRVISTDNAVKLARAVGVDLAEIASVFHIRDAGTPKGRDR